MEACNQDGFSHGPFVYASDVRLAPQETRTYLVTAVTAQRRSLFQVTATAELLEQNHPRLSQPGTVPFARVRDYAGPFPRSDYARSGCFAGKSDAVHQGRLFVPLEEQARCMDAQLQREPDPDRREVCELCTVHRGEPSSPRTCSNAPGPSLQLRWPCVGPHASPSAPKRRPGPEGPFLSRYIQGPEGPCSLRLFGRTRRHALRG